MPMREIVIYCPNDACRKPILRDAYLRIGSHCSMRCFKCGSIVRLSAEPGGVKRFWDKPETLTDKNKCATLKVEESSAEQSCFMVVET